MLSLGLWLAPAKQAVESPAALEARISLAQRQLCSPHLPIDAQRDTRRRLAADCRLYLTLYPGGEKRDEICRLEFATRFELAALAGGDFAEFERLIADTLVHPPCQAAEDEAAYWALVCGGLRRTSTGRSGVSPPARDRPLMAPQASSRQLASGMRAYSAAHPRSRHTPRMLELLFDAADAANDSEGMRSAAESLARDWPGHPAASRAQGRLRRRDAVGKPFWITGEAAGGAPLDTRSLLGRPLLIVVWAADCDRSRARLKEVEEFRHAHAEVAVVGVSLDVDSDRTRDVSRALGLAWPQISDGRGPATEFAREWGVDATPFVFVIDARGTLRGSTGDDSWRAWALAASERR